MFFNVALNRWIPELGLPERPKGMPRATRRSWNRLAARLLREKKLTRADGPRVMEWVEAMALIYRVATRAASRRAAKQKAAQLQQIFDSRAALPAPSITVDLR